MSVKTQSSGWGQVYIQACRVRTLYMVSFRLSSYHGCYLSQAVYSTICVRILIVSSELLNLIQSRRPSHSRRSADSWGLHCKLHLKEVRLIFFPSFSKLAKTKLFRRIVRINEFVDGEHVSQLIVLPSCLLLVLSSGS